jgi:holo-[acyl-carrier protein] synthase
VAIIGIGVDVIEVERVERALSRLATGGRFQQRVFTEGEIAYCESRGRGRYQSYAARFAAKEAVMKAMGTGWTRDVSWGAIETVRKRGLPPTIVLHGRAAQLALSNAVARFHLSLSHTTTLAIAYVLAES